MAVKSMEDFWWAIIGTYMPMFLFDPLCSHVFTNYFLKITFKIPDFQSLQSSKIPISKFNFLKIPFSNKFPKLHF